MNDDWCDWYAQHFNEYTRKANKVLNSWTVSLDFGEKEFSEVDLLSCAEDRGFAEDILSWLRASAPRKIRFFLSMSSSAGVTYEFLCMCVYELGFRGSDLIERRMVLGPVNKWVKLYFEDFPLGS